MRYFEMGVDSWIGGGANALPAEHVALLEAALAGDTATAWAWQKQMMPMLRSAERTHYTPKVRHALELRGVTVGPPRPPLAALDASEAHEVATRLAIALGQTAALPSTTTHGPLAPDATPLPMHTDAYINGAFVPAASGATMDVHNPATGQVIATVAACGAEDVDRAVAAAREVFERGEWSRAHPAHRRRVLTRFAKRVVVVHRRDEFRASKIMRERVLAHPKIEVRWNARIGDILGDDHVTGVRLIDTVSGAQRDEETDGVFVAIGHRPNTEAVRDWLAVDEKGYLVVRDHTGTDVPGVFVAGDVHDHRYRQAVTAAGDGCRAAIDVERWLEAEPAAESLEAHATA
jgi:predicted Fe-S protein YdhL (DUF1289 family)